MALSTREMASARRPTVMFQWYRGMRGGALVLAALAGIACRRSALQEDGGGTGSIGFDAASPGDAGTPPRDAGGLDAIGAGDDGPPAIDASCGQLSAVGFVSPPEILIVLDRSITIEPARWNEFLSAITAVIGANNDSVDWGLYTFPQDGPACGAGTLSSAIDVEIAPLSAVHVVAHMVASGTGASGTPIAAAIDTAAAHMLARTTQNPRFLMLVTDGAPTCAGTADPLTADRIQAQADAVAAITRADVAGVPTLVLAPSSTAGEDAEALNALAEAGRYPHAPPGPKFTTEVTAREWIQPARPDSSCIYGFGHAKPAGAEVVAVTFNGEVIPRDRSHMSGWDYTDANMTAVSLYGSWCDRVKASRSWNITFYFGCTNPG